MRMHKVAVIGPLGSGKSEIIRICSEMDFPTISSDHIARMLLELPGVAHDDVAQAFPAVIDMVGRIDRKKLAADVFHNHEHLVLLESIIHPHVWQIVASFFMECEKKSEEFCFVEVTAPDQTIQTRFDEMWLVTADVEVRKNRCVERGMSGEDFDARNAFQLSQVDYEELATRTLINDNNMDELSTRVREICNELSEATGK